MYSIFGLNRNTDDTDQTNFHGSVRIRVIRAIRVPLDDFSLYQMAMKFL